MLATFECVYKYIIHLNHRLDDYIFYRGTKLSACLKFNKSLGSPRCAAAHPT